MKVQNMVPEVYYKDSRDFSYIGRLYEILFNHMKTNADLVNSNLVNIDSDDLLNSLCYTLGFEPKHTYNNKDLLNICSAFVNIMRNKGTYYAIDECVRILLNSQYLKGDYMVIPNNENFIIEIGLPPGTQDIVLLEDLLDYILPTGWMYRISTLGKLDTQEDKYNYKDETEKVVSRLSSQLAQISRQEAVEDLPVNIYEYDDNTNDYSESNNIANNKSQIYSGVVYRPDLKTVNVIKNIDEAGNVTGAGIYNINSQVILTATTNSGYAFDGWYVNDERVSIELTYSFIIQDDIIIEARWNLES